MLYRLLNVTRRAGDLRVYKDGDITFGVRAGKFLNDDSEVSFSAVSEQTLTDDATNYIYLIADGTLTKNTTGFPVPSVTPHIRLATIVTVDGSYDHDDITDYRGTSFLSIAGAAAGNLLGSDWQDSVADEVDFTSAEPASPTPGDRYINTATGTSSETSQSVTVDYIYQYNGTSWTEITPDEGTVCLVEDIDMLKLYNGSSWVSIGTAALLAEAQAFFAATDITGTEAETLTDGSEADSKHKHVRIFAETTDVLTSVDGANYAVLTTDAVLLCDADTGNLTIDLPAAGSSEKRVITVKKITAANSVIIDGNASETIDGDTSVTVTLQYASLTLVCDGSAWHII